MKQKKLTISFARIVFGGLFLLAFIPAPSQAQESMPRLEKPKQAQGQEQETRKTVSPYKRERIVEEQKAVCPHNVDYVLDFIRDDSMTQYNQSLDVKALTIEKERIYKARFTGPHASLGQTELFVATRSNFDPFPAMGCSYLSELHVKIETRHSVMIAAEFPPGSCMYDSLYELETELMLEEALFIEEEIDRLRADLGYKRPNLNVRGPDLQKPVKDLVHSHRQSVEAYVEGSVARINSELKKRRRVIDLQEFQDEIRFDCGL
jgi:hypothetical protein